MIKRNLLKRDVAVPYKSKLEFKEIVIILIVFGFFYFPFNMSLSGLTDFWSNVRFF